VLDVDGRRHELQVVRADAPHHVVERLLEGQPRLNSRMTRLNSVDMGLRLAHDQLDGLKE
jgi:hypothetical protein